MRLFCRCLFACCLALPFACRAVGPAPAYEGNPDFLRARAEAQKFAKSSQDKAFAAGAWRKANKIAGGKCMECFAGMIQVARALGDPKEALHDAIAMEQAAETPADRGAAQMFEGRALMEQAGRDKPKAALLEQAHTAFTKATENDVTLSSAFFFDGMTLALLNRNAQAAAAFNNYLAHAQPSDTYRARAERLAQNPELVHQRMAPPVVVTTLGGKQFNLDHMGGRVVLIDFWATWCGPCNAELPHLQKLAARYANDPFEIISISVDSDEAKWKSFVADHAMTWNQYRDTSHRLSDAFAVNTIPRYFTIDSDGVLTAVHFGDGSLSDSGIEQLVKRARQHLAGSHDESAMVDGGAH